MIMTGLHERSVPSPIGTLRLVASDAVLVALILPDHQPRQQRELHPGPEPARQPRPRRAPPAGTPLAKGDTHPILDAAARELEEYFSGTRTHFDTPLEPRGTAFQCRTWDALVTIPFGETRTYTEIACAIGAPTATRAVGAANGINPLALFVPCHRVIGADGTLTGYGGGLPAKRWLLDHERRVAAAR